MGQFSQVLLAIDNAHTVPQNTLDCRTGIGRLNLVYVSNHPTPSVYSIVAGISIYLTEQYECSLIALIILEMCVILKIIC